MPALIQRLAVATGHVTPPDEQAGPLPAEITRYNAAAWHHEHLLEKYCHLLGTTLAAVISHEDRVALAYLRSRSDVIPERLGCIGLSGGGCRAALLRATSDQLTAAVVVAMMSTHQALLDHHVIDHTWMFFPAGAGRLVDWPGLAATGAPAPLLVQYDRDDALFPLDGMRQAHRHLTAAWQRAGAPANYTGQFYDGPHKFDVPMQQAAFSWLRSHLAA